MEKIGFVGAGRMGLGMIKNLVKAGYGVEVFDISEQACKQCVEVGADVVESPMEAAEDTDKVVLSLPGPKEVESIVLGPEGVAKSMEPGGIIADMSTIGTLAARSISKELVQKDLYFLDAPVSGGPSGADKGEMAIVVGGEKSAYEKATPIFDAMGSDILYVGESGAGQMAKLCHNMLSAVTVATLGEAFVIGEKAGLSRETLADVISKSVCGGGTLELFGPNIVDRNYENVIFSLDLMHKDLKLYMETSKGMEFPSLFGSLAFQLYSAAMSNGKNDLDHTAVVMMLENLSGYETN